MQNKRHLTEPKREWQKSQDKRHLTELRWEWQKLKCDESLPKTIRHHNIKKLMNTLEMKFCIPSTGHRGNCIPNPDALKLYEELASHL